MLSRLNTFLLVLLVVVVVACVVFRADYSRPNFELFPEMKYSPAWSTYEPNPHFADGRTLQSPVPGTIPRGQLPLRFSGSKEDAIRAGEELKNLYQVSIEKAVKNQLRIDEAAKKKSADEEPKKAASDDAKAKSADEKQKAASDDAKQRVAEARRELADSQARGGQQYRISCLCCHGAQGAGDGLVAKRGFPPPPSLLVGKSRTTMKDGQLFHILTYGQTTMPSFADQLSREQCWDMVNFLRSMQAKAPPVQPSTKK